MFSQQFLKWSLTALVFLSAGAASFSQNGLPLMKRYSVEEYQSGTENWDAMEDANGLMYFANSEGILEYDGVHWRLIPTANGHATRSFAKGSDGTIYVGGDYDFGYLKANADGQKEYISMAAQCPSEAASHLKHVWKVVVFQNKLFFLAEGWFIVFDEQRRFLKILKEDVYLRSVFVIDGQVFAYSNSKGILKLDGTDLQFKKFFSDPHLLNRSLEFISAHPKGGIRYHLFGEGFYHVYQGVCRPEKKTSENLLDTDYIFCQSTQDNHCILGTTVNGIYVVDRTTLSTTSHLNKVSGLNDNKVFAVFSDHYKNTWVCHENGLSYIAYNIPFRYLNEHVQIKGEGLCTETLQDIVYAGTTHGLFYCLPDPDGGHFGFEQFEAIRQPVFFLKKEQQTILAGTLHGLFELNGGTTLTQIGHSSFYKGISAYPLRDNYYLVSTSTGFELLSFNKGFKVERKVRGLHSEISDFKIDPEGEIWIIDSEKKLIHGRLNAGLDSFLIETPPSIEAATSVMYSSITFFKGQVLIGTNRGLYRYEKQTGKLHTTGLEKANAGNANINLLFTQNDSGIWMEESKFNHGRFAYSLNVLKDPRVYSGSQSEINPPVLGTRAFSFTDFNDSIVAIGVSDGFLLYNTKFNHKAVKPSRAYIREVLLRDEHDTTFIEGVWTGENNFFTKKLNGEMTTAEFNCAANYYYSTEKVFYSYRLEGADNKWSEWTKDNTVRYTIQGHGTFTFYVRTTNNHKTYSDVTAYTFTIDRPWYQTYWWYATELITLILLMSLSFYLNRNGSSHVSRISAVILLLTILTGFETMSEVLQDWLNAAGVTIFALKIAINITLALSINPIETWLKKKLIARPINP